MRASGVLLHPTSLPGKFGIGDLGQEAYDFVDFLAGSFQQIWQVLPLGPTGFGNSPYLCYSALAGNPLLISLEQLQKEELLSKDDLASLPEYPDRKVNYDLVVKTKIPLLKTASDNFKTNSSAKQQQKFAEFCQQHAEWLDDYVLFMALKESFNGASWNQWDEKVAKRDSVAIAALKESLKDEIFFHKFLQFEFFSQWTSLKTYANKKGIQIFGDIPIYVAHDSADVWSHPDIFQLDKKTGEAALMAGVPPDYFSNTGQLWGNPVYDWETLKATEFKWWIGRVKAMLEQVDLIRIDHFRGFEAFWAVSQGEKTAMNGKWIKAPGEAFFELLNQKLGRLPIVAEDLGVITPDVEALRDKFNFPGMKILQFAFDSDRANAFLPFNYARRNCVVYTGTHDNDTTVGWFDSRSPEDREKVVDYLGCVCREGIHWSLIRLALSSVGDLAILPLQDLLGLGSEAKMNSPGQAEGNWQWRYHSNDLTHEIGDRLKHLTYLYGRAPQPKH